MLKNKSYKLSSLFMVLSPSLKRFSNKTTNLTIFICALIFRFSLQIMQKLSKKDLLHQSK